jgi:uncharacterized alpha/beta hydrolase family protein
MKRSDIILVILLVFSLLLVVALVNWEPTTSSEKIVSITVKEKYAVGHIPGIHGGTYTNAKIVDTDGNLYEMPHEELWAKMDINQIYPVKITTTHASAQPKISAVMINGTWYY